MPNTATRRARSEELGNGGICSSRRRLMRTMVTSSPSLHSGGNPSEGTHFRLGCVLPSTITPSPGFGDGVASEARAQHKQECEDAAHESRSGPGAPHPGVESQPSAARLVSVLRGLPRRRLLYRGGGGGQARRFWEGAFRRASPRRRRLRSSSLPSAGRWWRRRGFSGGSAVDDGPVNSALHHVLARKTEIPIARPWRTSKLPGEPGRAWWASPSRPIPSWPRRGPANATCSTPSTMAGSSPGMAARSCSRAWPRRCVSRRVSLGGVRANHRHPHAQQSERTYLARGEGERPLNVVGLLLLLAPDHPGEPRVRAGFCLPGCLPGCLG